VNTDAVQFAKVLINDFACRRLQHRPREVRMNALTFETTVALAMIAASREIALVI
jgi:hypothetical protein